MLPCPLPSVPVPASELLYPHLPGSTLIVAPWIIRAISVFQKSDMSTCIKMLTPVNEKTNRSANKKQPKNKIQMPSHISEVTNFLTLSNNNIAGMRQAYVLHRFWPKS